MTEQTDLERFLDFLQVIGILLLFCILSPIILLGLFYEMIRDHIIAKRK
jgi:hypothetical protein